MYAYVLVVDFDREAFIAALDKTPMVRNWMTFLSSAIALGSYRTAQELTEYLHQELPGHSFLVNSAGVYLSNGYLQPQVWTFLNGPVDSGRHPPDVLPPNISAGVSNLGLPPQAPGPARGLTSSALLDALKGDPPKGNLF